MREVAPVRVVDTLAGQRLGGGDDRRQRRAEVMAAQQRGLEHVAPTKRPGLDHVGQEGVALEARIGVRGFQRRFLHAGRPGAYLAIVGEGELRAGDPVEIVHRPEHEVSVALVIEALLVDRSRVAELEPASTDMLPKLAGWYAELAE